MLNATYLYAELLGTCALLMAILFLLNIKYWKPKILNSLSLIYIFDIVACIVDLIWIFVDGKPEYTVLNHIYDVISLLCPTGIGIAYFKHADKRAGSRLFDTVMKKCLWSILPAIVTAFILTSPLTGLVYDVVGGCYVRGPLYIITCLVSYGYTALGAIICFVYMRKSELYVEKRRLFILGIFVLPGFILAALQTYILPFGIPTVHLGVLVSLLCLFACFQDEQITRDVLTSLPNRYSLDRILLDAVSTQKFGTEKELWLMFGDLDDFKQINDTYGHTTGDRALQLASEALSELCSKYGVIAGRLGGDEFVAVSESENGDDIKCVANELPGALKRVSENEKYDLVMSIGIAKYEKGWNVRQFMDAADVKLYEMKREHKRHGQSSTV